MQLSFRKILARFNICTVLAILKLTLTDNFLNDIRVTGFPSKMRWISYPTHLQVLRRKVWLYFPQIRIQKLVKACTGKIQLSQISLCQCGATPKPPASKCKEQSLHPLACISHPLELVIVQFRNCRPIISTTIFLCFQWRGTVISIT